MTPRTSPSFVGPIIASAGIALALLFTFAIAPGFAHMFRDFGGTLPWLTRFMLTSWGPLALAMVVLGASVASVRVPITSIVIAIVGLVLEIATAVIGLYLPIFQLAGSIR